jgi:hypothetical protein
MYRAFLTFFLLIIHAGERDVMLVSRCVVSEGSLGRDAHAWDLWHSGRSPHALLRS